MTLPVVFTANGPSGYNLTNSLRFRSSASAYMNRTPATDTSSNKKMTFSFWVKLGSLASGTNNGTIVSAASGYSDVQIFSNTIYFGSSNGSGYTTSAAVVRDYAGWYHIVLVADTTQATANNRMQIYINGVLQTAYGAYNVQPTQNSSFQFLNTNQVHNIGRRPPTYNDQYFDGYLAEMNYVDGQALTPSSFGSTNALTGVWQPAKYTGTYGTNGFYLPFTDVATTSGSNAGLGKDFSGNGNYFNTNNISVTAGTTYDSMTDVPTLTSATTANYTVWNPLQTRTAAPTTYSNGNLRVQFSDTGIYQLAFGTIGIKSNKYYWEVTVAGTGTQGFIGIADISSSASDVPSVQRVYANNGQKSNYSSSTSYGASYTASDVIGVAVDADSGTITFYKNNTSQGVAFTDIVSSMPASGWTAFAYGYNGTDLSVNFGQQGFKYTPPTGFVALNTYNLPTSTIVKGNTVMDATTYTGTLLSNAVTNTAGFKPDLVWIKSRSAATNNKLTDSVRGTTKALISNTTGAETTDTQGLTAFGTGGFTVGTNTDYNNLAATYVGWQWQAGQGSSSSNTNGSITSTVSVNATAGFSVVTYTGTGSAATVGHGLGVAPSMVMAKSRSNNTGDGFVIYHKSLPSADYWLDLSTTGAQSGPNSAVWNGTAPTSTVFSIKTASGTNTNTYTYVAYCWTPIAGFSSFGSYTGNGSTDGPFVYLGFRPRWIMFKDTGALSQWRIWDTSRDTYNVATNALYANQSLTEQTTDNYIDILSNGFKVRSTNAGVNTSLENYIYMAFAENPFKNALAR